MAALLHVFSAHVEEVVGKMTEPALVFTLYYHLDLLRKNGHFACQDTKKDTIDYIPGVRTIEPKDMMSYLQETDTSSVCHQIIFNAFQDARGADFILCNSVEELESETISALCEEMSFFAVGPIFPSGFTKSFVHTSLWSESSCNQWLNNNQLCLGARPDIVSSVDADLLPVGYREEVGDRGMLMPWCYQVEVLAHPAIGGFLTHCGWNSILESICCKIPLLCFPLLTDQFTNRKLVVEDWNIGINLSNEMLITKENVSLNINRLMGEKSGDEYRKAISQARQILENALTQKGTSEKNLDQFIKDLTARIQGRAKIIHIEIFL
ncbi:hypothetical protein FH972_010345 [Carpinus fangiana]|uniref:UDP-glycosyltransferases domain-containing protein n=1 Tax=Carpinus fangiana TaxID=176857 RepID=A0A660KN06_9ROSI|nr:hypothetical protein FH972_010345 [Carpinus fangiana]